MVLSCSRSSPHSGFCGCEDCALLSWLQTVVRETQSSCWPTSNGLVLTFRTCTSFSTNESKLEKRGVPRRITGTHKRSHHYRILHRTSSANSDPSAASADPFLLGDTHTKFGSENGLLFQCPTKINFQCARDGLQSVKCAKHPLQPWFEAALLRTLQ